MGCLGSQMSKCVQLLFFSVFRVSREIIDLSFLFYTVHNTYLYSIDRSTSGSHTQMAKSDLVLKSIWVNRIGRMHSCAWCTDHIQTSGFAFM